MRAAFMYGAGDVRVIDVPDPVIQQPTDAIVRVVRACICGSDLHPYHSMPVTPAEARWVTSSSASPARAYIETLMPDVLAGRVDPGRVFDREVVLEQTPQGYKDMDSRQALNVLVRP